MDLLEGASVKRLTRFISYSALICPFLAWINYTVYKDLCLIFRLFWKQCYTSSHADHGTDHQLTYCVEKMILTGNSSGFCSVFSRNGEKIFTKHNIVKFCLSVLYRYKDTKYQYFIKYIKMQPRQLILPDGR